MELNKGVKCFGLLLVLFIIFGLSLNVYSDVNAIDVTYMDGSDSWKSKNGETFVKVSNSASSLTSNNLLLSVPSDSNTFRVNKIAFAFPINKSLQGQYIDYSFNTGLNISPNGTYSPLICQGLKGTLMFANSNSYNGLALDSIQVSVSCSISSNRKEVWLGIQGSGKFLTSQTVSHAYVTFSNPDNYIFSCSNQSQSSVQPCTVGMVLRYYQPVNYLKMSEDPSIANQNTIISQNNTIIEQNQTIIDQNSEYYSHEYDSINNIDNQSSSDIPNSESQQTSSLIGVISSFISSLSGFSATNCQLTLPFPSNLGGDTVVNVCSGKEKAPTIVSVGSSLALIAVFVPLAFVVLKMIYNEIRSWTNG